MPSARIQIQIEAVKKRGENTKGSGREREGGREGGREREEGRGRMSESGEGGREGEERGSVRKNHAVQERVLVHEALSY